MGGELVKTAYRLSACLKLCQSDFSKDHNYATLLLLSGYGDKEVYTKLNPELEKRLPRDYTEWRRYSQGCH